MTAWSPALKQYPHFDAPIRAAAVLQLVTDPVAVAKNSFYPFLRFEESWQPFRSKVSGKPDKKVRELRFASRRDAYIYSYYRHLLLGRYEEQLRLHGLSDSVIAYRKIVSPSGKGKSNIDFALDAFQAIRSIPEVAVVTLDISKFFESLDHDLLESKWKWLLDVIDLPPDHAAVFRAITHYAIIDRDAAYERLGYLSWTSSKGRTYPTYRVRFEDMPKQLCSNRDFREKICGKGGTHASLIKKNDLPYGIPQGSPISDLLANVYLFDFDLKIKTYCEAAGGVFYRYSDDIILILPGKQQVAEAARDYAINEIIAHGSQLKIKASKTSVITYSRAAVGQTFTWVDGQQGKNGLEYLGFRYDGQAVFLRDATLSRLYRKVSRAVRAEVKVLVRRYPGKDEAYLESKFDIGIFLQTFGRVEDFDRTSAYKDWTFWTYVSRALLIFGALGLPIAKQLQNYKAVVRRRVVNEIAKALA